LHNACQLAEKLRAQQGGQVDLLGPIPAPMERRAGKHRAQLLLKATTRSELHRLLTPWLVALENQRGSTRVRWSLDVDPMDLL